MYTGPHVLEAQELLDKALRRAAKVTKGGKTKLFRERDTAIARLRIATDILVSELERYEKGFPSLDRLHPFHREMAGILADLDRLKKAIGASAWAATAIRRVSRDAVRAIARSQTPAEVLQHKRAAIGRLSSLVNQVKSDLLAMASGAAAFRRLPVIHPEEPTIVIAGAPNVGKSQLVRAMSSGRPEVAAYPFTTKALSVGHFEHNGVRIQVIDTPGLLDRAHEKRNPIERQAVAALRHVGHVVIFLFDPSETCGTPIDLQEALRVSLKAEMPGVTVLEVHNKADVAKVAGKRKSVSALTKAGVAPLARVAAGIAIRAAEPSMRAAAEESETGFSQARPRRET